MSSFVAHEKLSIGDAIYHVAFTSQAAGNLGLHVGDALESLAHRYALEQELGLPAGSTVYLNQVHGTTVATDEDFPQQLHREATKAAAQATEADAPVADAAVCVGGARPLGILVADCIPLVMVGQHHKGEVTTAVAHAGRRGLLDGVIQETLLALEKAGVTSVDVWVGPSICGRCYEVPEQMQLESQALLPGIASRTSWGTAALDLPRAAVAILKESSLVNRIETSTNLCTRKNTEVSSHRRGDDSRIAGLIWKEPTA